MIKQKIIIVLALIALIAGSGIATYEKSVQIDLGSGVIRDVRTTLWITIYRSSPKQTTLSQAVDVTIQPNTWLTVWTEGFSFPRTRTNPCYPRMLFKVGAIDRGFDNEKMTALVATMTLKYLAETEDACLVNDRLEILLNALLGGYDDSWSDTTIDSEIARIWKNTETEQAASSNH